jgi:cation transport regulator ChaC
MTQSYGRNNLAIFAYGSLLSDPGEKIAPRIVARVARLSPWPVEYARRAKLRGHGPTLVIHKSGGAVRGQLLLLDVAAERIDEVEEWLWKREGWIQRGSILRPGLHPE